MLNKLFSMLNENKILNIEYFIYDINFTACFAK